LFLGFFRQLLGPKKHDKIRAMLNVPASSFVRILSPVPFLLSFTLYSVAQADIEPPLENLVTNYFIVDVEGKGDVQVLKEGQALWKKVAVGARLEEGDQISVGDDTEVVLSLKSETLVHLDEGTKMSVSQLAENKDNGFLSRLKLLGGAVLSDVQKHLSETHSQFEVDAGGVVCGVRGTVFETAMNGSQVQTSTEEGMVQVQDPRGSVNVGPGKTSNASVGRPPSLHSSSAQTRERFNNWRKVRQRLHEKRTLKGKSGMRVSHSITAHPLGQRMGHNPAGGGEHAAAHGGVHAATHAGGHR
jgi:hypothetical protein